MRWDELFADLEGQLEDGLHGQERELEVEEERLRLGRLTLRDRLAAMGSATDPVRVRLADGGVIDLVPRTIGRDWVSGDLAGEQAQAVLPIAAVAALLPTAEQLDRIAPPAAPTALTDRITLSFVLRDLARRRRRLRIRTRAGDVSGTLDRVARDHLDLAVHPADRWRRTAEVTRVEVIPIAELLLVRVD